MGDGVSPNNGWFNKRGDEHPAMAGRSKRAREKLDTTVYARFAEIGLQRGEGNLWFRPLSNGLFLSVYGNYRSSNPKVEVAIHFPYRDGTLGKWDSRFGRRTVSLLNPDWPEHLDALLAEVQIEGEASEVALCPICESVMVLREAQRGPHEGESFYGCSRFPDCRGYRAPWGTSGREQADDGADASFPCPECGGEMRVRYAKQGPAAGQRFYGCGNYPSCERVVDDEAEAMALRLMGDSIEPKRRISDVGDL